MIARTHVVERVDVCVSMYPESQICLLVNVERNLEQN